MKCAFYGSLRKGMYNYDRFLRMFGKESMKFLETVEVSGFSLKDLSFYPAAVKEEGSRIVVDLFEVSKQCYQTVQHMELGAGYYEDELKVQSESYKIFLMKNWSGSETVPGGDWVKFTENSIKNTEKVRI